MPELYADTTGSAGIVADLNFGDVDPQFVDPANGNFTIKVESVAFATGDPNTEIAGSIIADELAATDIGFIPIRGAGSHNQVVGFSDGTADVSTTSREGARSGTVDIVTPSLGAVEPSLNRNYIPEETPPVATIFYEDESGESSLPPVTTIGGSEEDNLDDSQIIVRIPSDQIDDGEIDTDVEIVFDTGGAILEDDGNIRFDETVNINNSSPGTIQHIAIPAGPDFIARTHDEPTSPSGISLQSPRRRRRAPEGPCADKPDLIGLDYNLNTLVCISLQYRRNVINVPYGPGVAWQQGPPSIRLRGKNVYRVMNNSPSGDYIK